MLAAADGQSQATRLQFETKNYLVRSLEKGDVSEGWCNWLTDQTMADLLNAQCRKLSRDELESYIAKFDNRDRIILGIYHRPSATHIGVMTILASHTGQDALINLIIGEDRFRAIGNIMEMREVRTAVSNYLFFERGFRAMFASVVAHNARVLAFMRLAGWEVIDRVPSKPSATGRIVDLVLLRKTRESYMRREGKSWTMESSSPRNPR